MFGNDDGILNYINIIILLLILNLFLWLNMIT